MIEGERQELQRLADKWEGEANQYETRTDDDYSANAMMLRYCAAQLSSGLAVHREATREHVWEFYMNGSFCQRCGAAIGSGQPCR